MANNYYSLRKNSCLFVKLMHSVDIPRLGSYDHFCFFDHIQQSAKKKDDFAFFIFFTFKSKNTSDSCVEGLTLYYRLEAFDFRRRSSSSHQCLDFVCHLFGEKR